MDADSLACACGILDLVDPEPKKGNLKLLLKCILRQFIQEDVKGSDDGGSSLVHETTRSPLVNPLKRKI